MMAPPVLMLVLTFMCVLLWVECRRRPKQPGGPRLLGWQGSHDALLLHPAIAVVVTYQGNDKRAQKPDMVHERIAVAPRPAENVFATLGCRPYNPAGSRS